MTTKVLICEDDGLFREMLHTSLANQPSMEVVGSVADGASVIQMARELKPQVVLVDIELESEPNGIEAGQLIKEEDPSVGVVILSIGIAIMAAAVLWYRMGSIWLWRAQWVSRNLLRRRLQNGL